MRTAPLIVLLLLTAPLCADEAAPPAPRPYEIVDTAQVRCYDTTREIAYPAPGRPFFGQDAHYAGHAPRYRDLGDGTVLDLVTRLNWQKSPGPKVTWSQAAAGARTCQAGGHADWRLPTIKEFYSLMLFNGVDVDPQSQEAQSAKPFLDTSVFDFAYGDTTKGERIIDSQWATATKYVHTTMHGAETVFGVNFADGRIKGYGLKHPRRGGEKTFFVRYVRGNPQYGKNDFVDNRDGTISDHATGLTWMKHDSGALRAGPRKDGRLTWEQALAFAEDLTHAGHDDWRLPNAKELQSLVDYDRSPATTQSAAIDPVFEVSRVRAEDGSWDFPFYWSSTTHVGGHGGEAAVYIAFGRAGGWMRSRRSGSYELLDAHGAGAQRSDPKAGDAKQFPHGRGPQGDVIRILNHVRCVRGGQATRRRSGPPLLPAPSARARRPAPAAGEADKGPDGSAWIRRLDRDGDGKVSRAEFDGPPQHFAQFDRNGDGFLEADEAPRGPPPGDGPPRKRR